jgi:hypothetical protein
MTIHIDLTINFANGKEIDVELQAADLAAVPSAIASALTENASGKRVSSLAVAVVPVPASRDWWLPA